MSGFVSINADVVRLGITEGSVMILADSIMSTDGYSGTTRGGMINALTKRTKNCSGTVARRLKQLVDTGIYKITQQPVIAADDKGIRWNKFAYTYHLLPAPDENLDGHIYLRAKDSDPVHSRYNDYRAVPNHTIAVPRELLYDNCLSLDAKYVYVVVKDLLTQAANVRANATTENDKYYYPSMTRIMSAFKGHRYRFMTAWTQLITAGYITKTKMYDHERRRPYWLYETKNYKNGAEQTPKISPQNSKSKQSRKSNILEDTKRRICQQIDYDSLISNIPSKNLNKLVTAIAKTRIDNVRISNNGKMIPPDELNNTLTKVTSADILTVWHNYKNEVQKANAGLREQIKRPETYIISSLYKLLNEPAEPVRGEPSFDIAAYERLAQELPPLPSEPSKTKD